MFQVIVAGSRSFNDYSLLRSKLDKILQNVPEAIEIVSGTALGADRLGERYALERGFKLTRMPADWSLGKKAGPIRNEAMAKYVAPNGGCIMFWDGLSTGSQDMIRRAKAHNLKLRIIQF